MKPHTQAIERCRIRMEYRCLYESPRADTKTVGLGERDLVQPSDSNYQNSHPPAIHPHLCT